MALSRILLDDSGSAVMGDSATKGNIKQDDYWGKGKNILISVVVGETCSGD